MRSAGTGGDVEGNRLALDESAHAGAEESGTIDVDVGTVIPLDEAEPLAFVEPLDGAFCHVGTHSHYGIHPGRRQDAVKAMFSKRIRWSLEENDLARALARRKAAGAAVLDLTESNPTRAGIAYPEREILTELRRRQLCFGTTPIHGERRSAREAVSRYYRERGAEVHPDQIFLTASTSEGYGFLFKLLCDPGDQVLVPRPSYPLFDFLAALDAVSP